MDKENTMAPKPKTTRFPRVGLQNRLPTKPRTPIPSHNQTPPIDHQQRTQVLAKIDHQQRTQVLTRIGQNMANPQALNRNPIYQESSNQQNITNKNPTHNSTTN
jgi:hypothetical protein